MLIPMRDLLVAVFLLFPVTLLGAELNVRVLDVGEGQAVLLHGNHRAILIDTGHAGKAGAVLERMKSLGILQLDYLVLTHLHADHASGYFRINEQYPKARVLDNCYPAAALKGDDIARWTADALAQNPRRRCVKQGDTIDWQGTEIKVLWPASPFSSRAGLNHSSIVILVSRGDQHMLVMGDAGKSAESAILQTHSMQPVDILVVGHHGADDASSDQFLGQVRPRQAVISINRDNIRGYPSLKTLQRLKRYSDRIHLTYEQGEFAAIFE